MRKFLVSVVGATTGVYLGLAGPAMAQGDGERVGENIGDLLGGWAENLFLGIAGLVALLFLLNRKFGDLAIFLLAATVVGGFVMAPEDIAGTIRDIWQTITS